MYTLTRNIFRDTSSGGSRSTLARNISSGGSRSTLACGTSCISRISRIYRTPRSILLARAGCFATALAFVLFAVPVAAQDDRFADVTIETVPISGDISMLIGAGGNIGVSAGDDGILIIDDQFAPLAERIKEALADLGPGLPQFVLNTHFHGDHVGGNVEFGADGVIVAHENVRRRMQDGDSPAVALPVVTFADGLSIHFNGEEIRVIHLPTGHTDTDSVVIFTESNVIHMGDLFFNGRFPFVDLGSGGNLQGFLDNVQQALSMIDDDTAVIPGHGPLADKDDLQDYHDAVQETASRILAMKEDGMSVEDAVEAGLPEEYESWGQGFINEQRWIETVYNSDGLR